MYYLKFKYIPNIFDEIYLVKHITGVSAEIQIYPREVNSARSRANGNIKLVLLTD